MLHTCNLDVLLLASALVCGCHAENTVGVNVELDLDLWCAAGRGGDAVESEGTQALVVTSELTLTLQCTHTHTTIHMPHTMSYHCSY